MPDPNSTARREILPIPDIAPVGLTTYDAKDPDTKYPPIVPLRPPKGAPNVLLLLIDDKPIPGAQRHRSTLLARGSSKETLAEKATGQLIDVLPVP